MNMIRPVSDLRNNFAEISKTVHETAQPVFLTKNGYGDMVVMSIEAYEERMRMLDVYAKLASAEQQVASGQVLSAEDSLKGLREKYGL